MYQFYTEQSHIQRRQSVYLLTSCERHLLGKLTHHIATSCCCHKSCYTWYDRAHDFITSAGTPYFTKCGQQQ